MPHRLCLQIRKKKLESLECSWFFYNKDSLYHHHKNYVIPDSLHRRAACAPSICCHRTVDNIDDLATLFWMPLDTVTPVVLTTKTTTHTKLKQRKCYKYNSHRFDPMFWYYVLIYVSVDYSTIKFLLLASFGPLIFSYHYHHRSRQSNKKKSKSWLGMVSIYLLNSVADSDRIETHRNGLRNIFIWCDYIVGSWNPDRTRIYDWKRNDITTGNLVANGRFFSLSFFLSLFFFFCPHNRK